MIESTLPPKLTSEPGGTSTAEVTSVDAGFTDSMRPASASTMNRVSPSCSTSKVGEDATTEPLSSSIWRLRRPPSSCSPFVTQTSLDVRSTSDTGNP
jgi:hypothetical protein